MNSRNLKITSTKSRLGSTAIREMPDHIFQERWSELTREGPQGVSILDQMIRSQKRKLIPPDVWEDLVYWSAYEAVTNWKPDRPNGKKCPLRNYAWLRLGWKARGWWAVNKHTILNSTPLDAIDPDDC